MRLLHQTLILSLSVIIWLEEYYQQRLTWRQVTLKFSPTWSCVSLPRPTTSSGWKLLSTRFTPRFSPFLKHVTSRSLFCTLLCTMRTGCIIRSIGVRYRYCLYLWHIYTYPRAHDVVATLNQRQWRWFNVTTTSCVQWVWCVAGRRGWTRGDVLGQTWPPYWNGLNVKMLVVPDNSILQLEKIVSFIVKQKSHLKVCVLTARPFVSFERFANITIT